MEMNVELQNTNNHLTEIEQIQLKEAQRKEERRLAHNRYVCGYITCECKCQVMRCNLTSHKRTRKHQLLVTAQNQEASKQDNAKVEHERKVELLKLILPEKVT